MSLRCFFFLFSFFLRVVLLQVDEDIGLCHHAGYIYVSCRLERTYIELEGFHRARTAVVPDSSAYPVVSEQKRASSNTWHVQLRRSCFSS